jgi:hypothetical protein
VRRAEGRRFFHLTCEIPPMSEATFSSQDSQAAWAALGDRMRKNRFWLVSALVACGLYMAVQGWVRLRASGGDMDWLFVHVSPTNASAVASPDAPPAPQARASEPQAKHKERPEQIAKAPSTPIGQGPRSTAKAAVARNTRTAVPHGPAHPVRSPAERRMDQTPETLIEQRAVEELGTSLGEWIAHWEGEKAESRARGLKVAASAVARYARREPSLTQTAVPSPPVTAPDPHLPVHAPGLSAPTMSAPSVSLPSKESSTVLLQNAHRVRSRRRLRRSRSQAGRRQLPLHGHRTRLGPGER